jgi:ribonucleoside-diphosphate reductase alpha chain
MGLIKTKLLVGGSEMKYANPNVHAGLKALDYDPETIQEILDYVDEHEHVEGSALHDSHLAVFDCSSSKGNRRVSVEGHIEMIAAVQPFLSGGISKTYNMPNDTTVPEIEHAFLRAWEAGIKCITIYRDGSKMSEPMRMREVIQKAQSQSAVVRNHPPDDMDCKRHGFKVGGHKGYLHISLDPVTGRPIEIFIRVARFGTTVGGLLDSYAKLFSYGLQHGIPLEVLTHQMEGISFPPSGPTQNPRINMAKSILDYIGKYLRYIFLDGAPLDAITASSISVIPMADDAFDINEDMCPDCGALMVQTGTCQRCNNCSYSDGVCG